MKPASTARATGHRVTRTLKAGQPGTLKLLRRFGAALVCVRYRQDANGTTRFTTVELVVEEGPVQRRLSDRAIVRVRIAWGELNLSNKAKAMGAKWEPATRLWCLSYKAAKALDIIDRIHPKLSIDKQPN